MPSAKYASRGFTLIASLLVLLLLSGFAVALLMMVNTEQRAGGNDLNNNYTYRATEGAMEKMTSDLGQKNPQLAQDIKDYFVRKQPGKPFSEGLEKVSIELFAVDNMAKQGKADLSKIQIESVVVYVVKQKFPPPVTAQK